MIGDGLGVYCGRFLILEGDRNFLDVLLCRFLILEGDRNFLDVLLCTSKEESQDEPDEPAEAAESAELEDELEEELIFEGVRNVLSTIMVG